MSEYRFTRYVNGKEKAEGVLVHADNLREAQRKAVDLVYPGPVTILMLDTDLLAAAQTERADAAYQKGADDERTHIWNVLKGFFHREEQKP